MFNFQRSLSFSTFDSSRKQYCPKTINIFEKPYGRKNESVSSFTFFMFFMDLSNLASILYGFKFQVILYKFLKKSLLGKRFLNDHLDLKNLNFFSIYLGLAIALLQFVYYIDQYIQFDTYKRMEIGKNGSIDELTFSICYEQNSTFLYSHLNYDPLQREIFLHQFRESILEISLPYEYQMYKHEIDFLVFNTTQIFFKDSAICFQFSLSFPRLYSSYGSIFFSYFIQHRNRVEIIFRNDSDYFDFDYFYLTKGMDLPYYAERFYHEHFFIVYTVVEMEYPMKTNCTHYKQVYREICSNQYECFQVGTRSLSLEILKKNHSKSE